LTPEVVFLTLKIAVAAVTLLLIASLIALAAGRPDWHGRLNTVFFILTATTVVAFEVVIRLVNPELTAGFTPEQRESLAVHLGFSIPAAILLPAMLWTGKTRRRTAHLLLAAVFSILWAGTVVTGLFYLPHSIEPVP
jgi:hypothetical protein